MAQTSHFVKLVNISPSNLPPLIHKPRRSNHHMVNRSSVNCTDITRRPAILATSGDWQKHVILTTKISLVPQSQERPSYGKILLSDVEVIKKRKDAYFCRKWSLEDVATALLIGTPHVLCLFYPFVATWSSLWVGIGFGLITGFGVTLSYHRNLAHRSFKLVKWAEYFFAYCGVLGLQKDPIFWVSVHRKHHMYTDTLTDPHTPLEGFWFSHIGWMFDDEYMCKKFGGKKYDNVADLKKQPFYRFLHRTYYAHPIAIALLLYVWGGFPYLVAAMGVSKVLILQGTFLATSVCHIWGQQPWKTNDNSKNNWFAAILTLGEGWHNNHHAFEYSARHGLEWWQIDLTWYLIKFLGYIGLASDIKLPSEAHKRALAKT